MKSKPKFTLAELKAAYDFHMHFAATFFLVNVGMFLENPKITGEVSFPRK